MSTADADRVRALWRELTGVPDAFTSAAPLVVGSDAHRASRPGWVGIVEVCGRIVVACPTADVERVSDRLTDRLGPVIDRRTIDRLLQPVDTLGPALLFYGRGTVPLPPAERVVGPLEIGDGRVQAVFADATIAERNEAGIEHATSGVYVGGTAHDAPAALCGWRVWPQRIAHMSILVAVSQRGRGYGLTTAAAALDAASHAGLLPQWRAAHGNHASIALARRLGLELLGHQYSVRMS